MNKKVFILGAGGHTRSLIILLEYSNYIIEGIYDENFNNQKEEVINKYKVLGKLHDINKDSCAVLSFGDNQKRKQLFLNLKDQILEDSLIHPNAQIEKYFNPGSSNQIFANVTLNSNVSLGVNNIINTGAILEHEVNIGDHNHISVGSIICGRVTIGSNCFIGAGATIIDKLSVCDDVIIGANSVVIKNIDEPGTYVGNPARRVK
ncbi:MAG: acetyltransferase [Bacteroidales bacterium]|nr:acetyltransferase [Bacteroidales bacterium]